MLEEEMKRSGLGIDLCPTLSGNVVDLDFWKKKNDLIMYGHNKSEIVLLTKEFPSHPGSWV